MSESARCQMTFGLLVFDFVCRVYTIVSRSSPALPIAAVFCQYSLYSINIYEVLQAYNRPTVIHLPTMHCCLPLIAAMSRLLPENVRIAHYRLVDGQQFVFPSPRSHNQACLHHRFREGVAGLPIPTFGIAR
jgi:hypothetical protein